MLRIGNVQLATNLLLAPIAGYTDLAFRLIVRRAGFGLPGVGLAFTELLCSNAIVHAAEKTMRLASTSPEDQPLGVQLYGRDIDMLVEAARWAESPQGGAATTIDINMGCPVDKVTKKNGGSMLLCEPEHTVKLARRVVQSVKVPVTAKIRLGWDDGRIVADSLPPRLADAGIAAITVHGRTTEQMFKPSVRLEGITRVVEAVSKHFPGVPVIGNGDVKTPEDVKRMIAVTGCAGVMVGRGALGQPWLFRDAWHYLQTGTLPDPVPRAARARLVLDHFELMLGHTDERRALNTMRSRMSWYSAHLQPWPGLRQAAHEIKSAQAFRDFMHAGIERIELQDGLAPDSTGYNGHDLSVTPADLRA